MMNNIEDFLVSFQEVEEPIQNKFYCHVDKNKLTILGVSPHISDNNDTVDVEISQEVALKFLTGEENLSQWHVLLNDDTYSILKKSKCDKSVNNRVEILKLVNIPMLSVALENADIYIGLDLVNGEVNIRYNGDTISSNPTDLYFTREDDVDLLKKTFELNSTTLSHLSYELNINGWPTLIKFPLKDIDDTSVFTSKSTLKISLTKYETRYN